jgi:hypothetical protein
MLYKNIIPDYLFGDVDRIILGNERIKCSNLLIYSRYKLPNKSEIYNTIFSKINNGPIVGDIVHFEDSFYGNYFQKIGSDHLSTSLLNLADRLYVALSKEHNAILSHLDNLLDSFGHDDFDNKDKILIENYLVPFEIDLSSFNEERVKEIKEKQTKFHGLDDLWHIHITLNNSELPSFEYLSPLDFMLNGDFINYSNVSKSLDILYSEINLENIREKKLSNERILDSSAGVIIDKLSKDYVAGKISYFKPLELGVSSNTRN